MLKADPLLSALYAWRRHRGRLSRSTCTLYSGTIETKKGTYNKPCFILFFYPIPHVAGSIGI